MPELLHRRRFVGAIARGVRAAACLAWVVIGIACGQRREPVVQRREGGPLPGALARDRQEEPRPPAAPETPTTPDDGPYVRACPLSGVRSGKLKIESNYRISLVDGTRTIATGETDDDFHVRQVEASCAKRSISLQLETEHEYREVTLEWKRRRLIQTSTVHQSQ